MKINDILAQYYEIGKNGFWVDTIQMVSIGTSTVKTKLGGTIASTGTGSDYTTPTLARSIVAIRPKIVLTTPTANQAVTARLVIDSADLKFGDYQVFANPIDSGLGTNETQFQDESEWYPVVCPCEGAEKVQVSGQALVSNTVAPLMGADIMLSDSPPKGMSGAGPPWFEAKIGPITNTGTATGGATDAGFTISGKPRRLRGLYAVVVGTTPAASKPISGTMIMSAAELAINPQRFQVEPVTGFLGTTTAGTIAHLTKIEWIDLRITAPSTIVSTFFLDQALTTTGNFAVGTLYHPK